MYFDISDRMLIAQAISVMGDLATDELSDQEVESMFAPNSEFILTALRCLTNHEDVRSAILSAQYLTETQLLRLDDIRSKLESALSDIDG